jgi:hypothetical protein
VQLVYTRLSRFSSVRCTTDRKNCDHKRKVMLFLLTQHETASVAGLSDIR